MENRVKVTVANGGDCYTLLIKCVIVFYIYCRFVQNFLQNMEYFLPEKSASTFLLNTLQMQTIEI